MPKLCLTLAEKSPLELQRKLHLFSRQVAMVEVRLDFLEQLRLPLLPSETSTQFLATLRPEREGGAYRGDEKSRLNLLQTAAGNGFHWIDLEHDVEEEPEFPPAVSLLRSYHNFRCMPGDLAGLLHKLKGLPGDAVKIAVPVGSTKDLTRLLKRMEEMPASFARVIIGMEEMGRPTRLLSPFLGNAWTYVAEEGTKIAPGQISLAEATGLYRLDCWNACPPLYGVIGNPVGHSRSPRLHNRLFQHFSRSGLYLPLLLDNIDCWFDYLEQSRLPFMGFSVTLPFKEEVTRFAAVQGATATLNTLKREQTGWKGLNTDWDGFLRPLLARTSLPGKKAVVLGNGGVAHTVVAALQSQGAEVVVVGRNAEKVARFARQYGCSWSLFSEWKERAHLCVNATPVGQHPGVDQSPLCESQLHFDLVYDLVYNPPRTRLLEMARQNGLETISGLEMFCEQAALQFQFWTGIDPDRQILREMVVGGW